MVSGRKTNVEVNNIIYCMGDKAEYVLLSFSLTTNQMKQHEMVYKAVHGRFMGQQNPGPLASTVRDPN